MKHKERLDVLLVSLGLAESRAKAQATIMAGEVYVNGQKADKAGMPVPENANVELRGKKMPYVSRGGYKLEKAIKEFDIVLTDFICMDVGASTGGFTDCMLMNGAKKVYSVDVGYGQLAWKLRCDERVVNLERTNARYLTDEQITDKLDFISVDASFISLKLLIPVIKEFLKDSGHIMCLIKPQFEAGREKVGKKGVVRDKNVHIEVIKSIYDFTVEHGLYPQKLSFSPIKGPEGNIEYLIYISKAETEIFDESLILETVENSHERLDGKNENS